MRILIVSSLNIPSARGDAVVVEKTAAALSRAGHEVVLLCHGKAGKGDNENFEIIRSSALSPVYGILKRIPVMYGLLRSRSFDIVHAIELFPFDGGGISLSRFFNKPFVYDFGVDPPVSYLSGYRESGSQGLFRRAAAFFASSSAADVYYRIHFKAASSVVAVSKKLKSIFCTRYGLPDSKVVVAPCGADVPVVSLEEGRKLFRKSVRQKLGLRDGPVIVHASSFRPFHGVEVLVRAFSQLKEKYPTLRLLLVGRNRDDPVNTATLGRVSELCESLRISDRVTFLDWMPYDELSRLYFACDVGVDSRSRKGKEVVEGFSPLKTLGYMAHGLPVVAADCDEIREIALEDDIYIFEPDNVDDLVHKLDMALSSERSESAGEISSRVLSRYTWDARAAILSRLYSDLLERRGV